jgi:hypothetical protein
MTSENVKLMIVDDNVEMMRLAKSTLKYFSAVRIVGGQSKSITFYLHPPTPFNAVLKPKAEHGEYRQFIKRDKRKNFKVNK